MEQAVRFDSTGKQSVKDLVRGLDDGAAMLLGEETEILAHRPSLPSAFLRNAPLTGRKASDLNPPALGDLLGRLWERARSERTSVTAEIILSGQLATLGEPLHLSIRVRPHPKEPGLAVVTVRDLTRERSRVRALMEQIDALRAQKDEWESVARTVAHDVRSSLAALSGFINLALKRSGEIPCEASEHLNKALNVSDRLKALTETVVRSEACEESAQEPVDLGQLGLRLFSALQAANPTVPFTWCVGAAEQTAAAPAEVLWDVVWNLLENSVKYRSPDRDLHIELRARREGDEIWIEVLDNGRGLAPGEADGLFQRERRGRNAAGVEGTGLGLFSARRLIEKCGGRVWAEPMPCGVCFRVALPAWST